MLHMGVSMWKERSTAVALGIRFPRLGEYVNEMELQGELGIWLAETSSRGHYTVWGRPSDLLRCAAC